MANIWFVPNNTGPVPGMKFGGLLAGLENGRRVLVADAVVNGDVVAYLVHVLPVEIEWYRLQ